MPWSESCDECARLWQEYSLALYRHINLQSQLRLAQLRHDQDAVQAISRLVLDAGKQREQLREQYAAHGRDAHAKQASVE